MSTLCNYSGAYIFMNGIVTVVDTSAAAAVAAANNANKFVPHSLIA